MDLKAKKESLSKQHDELTKMINKSLDMRNRVLGALELIYQIENEKSVSKDSKSETVVPFNKPSNDEHTEK